MKETEECPKALRVLVGNKSDLVEGQNASSREAKEVADSLGIKYYECSAKTGHNVRQIFEDAADQFYSEGIGYFEGMQDVSSELPQGVTRFIGKDGSLDESCYQLGLKHGLSRKIDGGVVTVALYKRGELQAGFRFFADSYHVFDEFSRFGPKQELLKGFLPSHLDPDHYVKMKANRKVKVRPELT